jgi:hypothetical protein
LLESKEDMRRRGVPSPDEGDAIALCFIEAVLQSPGRLALAGVMAKFYSIQRDDG